MEDLVKRIDTEMGLLDFQNENVMSAPALTPPHQPVTLKEALSYTGVVYVRGGLKERGRGPAPAANTISYPTLTGAPPASTTSGGGAKESPLTTCKVKLCRSEFCCPWKGQVRHARPVMDGPAGGTPAPIPLASAPAAAVAINETPSDNGAWSTPAATAAAITGGHAPPKVATSAGSVWSNVMPIPPRLASAVVASGSGPNPKPAPAQETDVNNNAVKAKGGSDSSVSAKSKKKSLGRFNTHAAFEKVRISRKGKKGKSHK